MPDIKETISTLNNLLKGAKSSKKLVEYVESFDLPTVRRVEELHTIKKTEVSLLKELINRAESKAREEQLYYVKSPFNNHEVLNLDITAYEDPDEDCWLGYASKRETDYYKTRFTQFALDSIQKTIPALDVEKLKVRVEDYDNE